MPVIRYEDHKNNAHTIPTKLVSTKRPIYVPTIIYSRHLAAYLKNKFLDYIHTTVSETQAYAVLVVENKAIFSGIFLWQLTYKFQSY